MGKLRYSGVSGNFRDSTVKELKIYVQKIGIKNRSKLKTRFQLIDAIEKFLNDDGNITYLSVKSVR
jgi:hypothetical protein